MFKTFGAFLFALFVLSSGLACIETAANPYVTVLGPKDGAAARLSVAQAFNSVAYIIAPTIGGELIFGKRHEAGAPVDFGSLLRALRGPGLRGAGRVRGLLVRQVAGH